MPRRAEPKRLKPRPPATWLEELGRRHPDCDPLASLAVLKLLEVSRDIAARMDEVREPLGLTEARFTVVMTIHRLEWQDVAATPSALAEIAGTGRATMTQIVDALERTGWVERATHQQDRRRVTVKLTARARRQLERYLPRHYRALAGPLAGLSTARRASLVKSLEQIAATLADGDAAAQSR